MIRVDVVLTKLEYEVFRFISENADPETMDCVDIEDLSKGLGKSPKILRDVISSLVKKNVIEVDSACCRNTANFLLGEKNEI